MSKVRMYILAAAVATAGIGLGGTFGASAVPINGNLIGATAPAPELHKVYYYNRVARRQYRRAYRRNYYGYGGYYGGYNPGYYGAYSGGYYPGYNRGYYRGYW
ncbi:MAG: hypothetical protein WA756_11665 [Pseudolabrys sp.]|jgi:hypothetical protein|nr:hypothetical protein [Pseudolabrys sp.]